MNNPMTDTIPVPPVPNREAVELLAATLDEQLPHFSPTAGLLPGQMLLALLAEVERLTFNLEVTKENFDEARATVAEQGAALRTIRDLLEGENYTAGHCVADDALAKQTP